MTPSASERLRQETRAPHERLEALPFFAELAKGSVPLARYVNFLRATRAFVRPLEEAAARSADAAVAGLIGPDERAAPLLDRDLAALDRDPHGSLSDAELRAVAAAQDLAAHARPARLAGYLYVLVGSQLGGLALRDQVAAALGLAGPEGLAFVSRGGPHAAARWRAFRARLDAALPDEGSVTEASRAAGELFEAFARSFEVLHKPAREVPYPLANNLNAEAGSHAVTDDPRELAAALRAGERTWADHPYYGRRYGARGRGFTRSDSAWLVTLAQGPASVVEGQIDWLSRVLAARGMPRLLLERHLLTLHDELAAALPERAFAYAALRDASRRLADARRASVDDARLAELARRFDEAVGPELAASLPGAGELLAAAVADEHAGVEQAVASLAGWLADPSRFPERWVAAVEATVAEARRAVSPRASVRPASG